MKCHLCSNWIEIHTDPKNTEYVVVSGARRKIEDWDPEENGSIALTDEKEKEKLESNAFYKLENDLKNKKKAEETVPLLTQLQNLNDRQWKDPYTSSYIIRKKFRERKKQEKQQKEEDQKFKDKHLLSIEILPENEEDEKKAKQAFKEDIYSSINKVNQRKLEIQSSSIFENKNKKRKNTEEINIYSRGIKSSSSSNNLNIYRNSKKSKQEAKLKSLANLKMNMINVQQKNKSDKDHSSTSLLIPDIQKSQVLPIYNEISLSKNIGIQKKTNNKKELDDDKLNNNVEESTISKNENLKNSESNQSNSHTSDNDNDDNALSLICQDYGDDDDDDDTSNSS
jgi:coiled-coil domain-containing protein 130